MDAFLWVIIIHIWSRTIPVWVSAHGHLSITCEFGPHGRYVTATFSPWNGVHGHLPRTLQYNIIINGRHSLVLACISLQFSHPASHHPVSGTKLWGGLSSDSVHAASWCNLQHGWYCTLRGRSSHLHIPGWTSTCHHWQDHHYKVPKMLYVPTITSSDVASIL